MPDETPIETASLVTSAETAAGFWQMGILWTPLIPGESTRGTYSLMEQLMQAKAGPPPHVHDQGEEVFYILDGEMALQLGDQVITGTSGQLVRIPAAPARLRRQDRDRTGTELLRSRRPRPAGRHARHTGDQHYPAPARSTATTNRRAGTRVRPAPARPGHPNDVCTAGPARRLPRPRRRTPGHAMNRHTADLWGLTTTPKG